MSLLNIKAPSRKRYRSARMWFVCFVKYVIYNINIFIFYARIIYIYIHLEKGVDNVNIFIIHILWDKSFACCTPVYTKALKGRSRVFFYDHFYRRKNRLYENVYEVKEIWIIIKKKPVCLNKEEGRARV